MKAGQTEVQSAVNHSSISVREGRTTIGIGSYLHQKYFQSASVMGGGNAISQPS